MHVKIANKQEIKCCHGNIDLALPHLGYLQYLFNGMKSWIKLDV